MKKKLFIALLVGCLATSPITVSASENTDISSMTLEELQQAYQELEAKYNALLEKSTNGSDTENSAAEITDADFEYSADGYTYKYLKNQVETIDGTDYVYVFFEYTNDSGQSTMPYYSLSTKAYQNGVEIQSYMSIDDPIPEANTAFKDVQTGTTTNIAIKYELTDNSPVSIELKPMVSWGDTEIGEYTFNLE